MPSAVQDKSFILLLDDEAKSGEVISKVLGTVDADEGLVGLELDVLVLVLFEPPVLLQILDDVELFLFLIAGSDLKPVRHEIELVFFFRLETDNIDSKAMKIHFIAGVVAVKIEGGSEEGGAVIVQLGSDSSNPSTHALVDGDRLKL